MELTVRDFLTFHRPDRTAYDHLLSLNAGPQSARDAVALLIWLYRTAATREDAVSRVPTAIRTHADAAVLVSEAHAALGGPDVAGATAPPVLLASLCGPYADNVRGVLAATPADVLRRSVDEVLAGVGALVFDDQLNGLMRLYEAGGPLAPQLAAIYRSYGPSGESREEYDARSLFITFAPGEDPPFTNMEIYESCSSTWGHGYVQKVTMDKNPAGEPLPYRRIVFYSADAVAMILGEQPLVQLVINGLQLWARKYVPLPPPQQ
ncbi:hypothetical protein QOZ80_4BG0357090 [Eleusine coracana subsp. coracana]|nr:hypothetical protein QOZ80_4BG0357090 [Eleusine coracana subsp. coracana]